jgi:hypothetical protein
LPGLGKNKKPAAIGMAAGFYLLSGKINAA